MILRGLRRLREMARLRLTYRSGRAPDEVSLGAFSQIAAKRRYGLEALKSDDAEPVLFGAWVELVGPAGAKEPDDFDLWLVDLDQFELIGGTDPDMDPPVAEGSSAMSPQSPPT